MKGELKLTELNRQEAARYLGYSGQQIDEKTQLVMDECEKIILSNAAPRFTYSVYDISDSDGLLLVGADINLTGEDIKNHLKGCEKAVLMAVTLSAGLDRSIRIAQANDMLHAVVIDAMASVAVEQACDKAELKIAEEFKEYYMTFRYGIGYGDLPLELQNRFIAVTQADKMIGLTATKSSMLTPMKSVTAIIGLSRTPVNVKARGCATCNMRGTCRFRQTGGYCYE